MTLDDVYRHYQAKSQADLACRLGVTQGAISQWKIAGRIPVYRQLALETVTNGALRADRRQMFEKLAG